MFRDYFAVLTVGFTLLFSFYVPINHKKLDETLSTCFQFSVSVIVVVLMLLTFIMITGKEIISKELVSNASHTIGWLMMLLFGTVLFALLGKNFQNKQYIEITLRLAIFMFILGFCVLVSFVSGLTFSL